jgi:ABC-2 type transport system ATP-binding protein
MTTDDVVLTEGLTKRFGHLVAVKNLSLRVPAGQIFGFLGLNGAGKTTTIRILLDLLRPTAGRATILGHDCQLDGCSARANVGYLPGEMRLYPDMTGRQVLDVFARLSALQPDAVPRQHALLERLSLPIADLGRRVREYSTGMKRKLGIVLAFQSDPAVLILDEPTEGLDPLVQEAFYALLDETRDRGRTVFMSSHVLSEVERVCDRIAILRKGEVVLDAPVEEIRRRAPRAVRVTFATDVEPPSSWLRGIEPVEIQPRRWELKTRAELGAFVNGLSGLPVADLDVAERRLEDIVIDYYRGTA